MSPITIFAVTVVNLALVAYGVGIVTEQRTHKVTARALFWLRLGVVLDVVATTAMILGSSSGPFTLHGYVGYSALAVMMTETGLAWRHRSQRGDEDVPRWLHLFSRFAYTWWVLAYFTGAWLVMRERA
ncbi:MAG: hypothetical protein AMXMBFR53_12800 [Gemmatimonadota bacterium]